jgi:tRNA-intron endonuclease, archaea type
MLMPKKTKKDPEPKRAEKKKDAAPPKEDKQNKPRLSAAFAEDRVLLDGSDESRELYNQSRYGSILESGKIQLSLVEGLYLLEKGKIDVKKGRARLTPDSYLKIALEKDPNFYTRYYVFKDIRNRGYIIKTALKFGADFRVYDRGIKPGEDHAKWIVYPVHESSSLTWYEFAAKNRVAHSTKKRLLIGIVDDEGDCTYYEIRWMRP